MLGCGGFSIFQPLKMASAVTAGGDAADGCRSILSRSILIIADAFSFNFVSVALDFVSLSLDFGLCSGYIYVCVCRNE